MSAESDDYLIRYILRDLPESEAERLDERSVTDEAFATRLRELENDLVDRYAGEGPTDERLNRLEQRTRDSAHLRGKVQFARALQAIPRDGSAVDPMLDLPADRRRWLQLFAAAAMLLLVTTGYLGLQTVSLREEIVRLEAQQAAAARQDERLQRDVDVKQAAPQQPTTAAFRLPPPRRGTDELTLVVPSNTTQVLLQIVIESSEYSTFWVSLQDATSGQVPWRSGDVSGTADGANRIVQVTIPVSSLKSGRYSLDVSGNTTGGMVEPAGTYPFRVVLE
jgi:hypothetical protein